MNNGQEKEKEVVSKYWGVLGKLEYIILSDIYWKDI